MRVVINLNCLKRGRKHKIININIIKPHVMSKIHYKLLARREN